MKTKIIVLVVLLAVILAACSPAVPTQSPTEAPTGAPTAAPTEIVLPTEAPTEAPISMEPATLKVGIFPYSAYTPQIIAQEEGFFAEQNLTVEFITFQKGPDAAAALASGQIDVFATMLDVGTLNAIAQGANIRYVADEGYIDPAASCAYSTWGIKKSDLDSGRFADLANVKGMKVSVPKSSLLEFGLYVLLKQANLTTADIIINDTPAQNRIEALTSGAVDIAQLGEPWVTRALDTGLVASWNPFNSYMPQQQFGAMYFGPTIYDGNQDVGKRFMVAYLKGIRQYNEGKTDRNVELMAQLTKLDPVEVKKTCWQSFRNDGSLDIQSILNFQEWALGMGYLDKVLPEAEFFDPQFLDYANQVLSK
jgi:NitT/TauT family transport system substrate-binding protein